MNNHWNKVIFRFWAPFYDYLFNSGPFLKARKKIFESLEIKPKSKILFVGVGTGADLRFIMGKDVSVTAIDLSPEMLDRAKKKYDSPNIKFMEMDAEDLTFSPESFDMVIANLILSVVPNPDLCFQEMIRVTRTGGRIVIFDKFAPPSEDLSLIKKIVRPVIAIMGTDIGRHFEPIIMPYKNHFRVEEDASALFNGMYRKKVLRKI
ncbi:class I SAM-dependent methyltransferase [Paenibacillus phoenicis]|jgi:ubiquinone/menaquinone biosynthesis C-methylase UbiE|uniref:Class I SAM-dependent methyltransferase n=1 Tax=Paenibacillus phoenicis TaxID=554117 RepID=A0ABU5PLF8_9BACL|nr:MULTISPECIES: class I SAM-dependent methyltransferase [Paenibacillus]MEA3570726.1 class I SAM-dependent methyltransferase [Paenibacillus phoenicis]